MARKKAHRAYPGGRRRFFRKMIRDYYAHGEFDPSVFPPPRLSPLPPVEEILEAIATPLPLGTEEPIQRDIDDAFKNGADKQVISPPPPRKRPGRAVGTFVPMRIPTRPIPPAVAIRKPPCSKNEAKGQLKSAALKQN